MKTKYRILILLGLVLALTSSAVAIDWDFSKWFRNKPREAQTQPSSPTSPAPTASTPPSVGAIPYVRGGAPDYRAIVERYGAAVVGVNTEAVAKGNHRGGPDAFGDDPFFEFFRGLPGFNGLVPHGDYLVRGQGSGFIIASNGLILTNAHVVRDADEVTVKLSDRREYKAKVLGSDKTTDVAVLKINADNLPVVTIGNPSQLGVGDYVLAIGSPFGFDQSATAGIVSAKGRSLPGDTYVPFIQTDVAVNPGNSGGPLFDTNGGVVGINSQIYSQTGGYQGVSFAIPIDVALRVKDQIVTSGKVRHARLGVAVQDLNQSLAESFHLSKPDGALIAGVDPSGSAAKAGIEAGDVILKYNGQPIIRSGDLPSMVSMGKPGDKIQLEVWRGSKKIDLTVTLLEAKESLAQEDAASPQKPRERLGLMVRPLTPQERSATRLPTGLLVEEVAGRIARAGVQAGDIIVSVNGASVNSIEQLQAIVSKGEKNLALLVKRGENSLFIPIELG